MNKILIIKGADFSEVAVGAVSTSISRPVITITPTGSVTIVDDIASAIYYTIDGSTPTVNSTEYSSGFTVSSGTIVKAISKYSIGEMSSVVTKAYTTQDVPSSANNYNMPVGGTNVFFGSDTADPTRIRITIPISSKTGTISVSSVSNQIALSLGSDSKWPTTGHQTDDYISNLTSWAKEHTEIQYTATSEQGYIYLSLHDSASNKITTEDALIAILEDLTFTIKDGSKVYMYDNGYGSAST